MNTEPGVVSATIELELLPPGSPGGLLSLAGSFERVGYTKLARYLRSCADSMRGSGPATGGGKATPSSRWSEKGEPDPHGARYNCERAALAMGDLTDDELANAVYLHGDKRENIADMAAGRALPAIVYLTAAKDRIRWLSRRLAEAATPAGGGDAEANALAEFTEYFVRNYPGPDTIISDPRWHAPRIFRAVLHAFRRLASSPATVGDGASLISAERQRQVSVEGWTPEHDDEHGAGDIAAAASAYALFASLSPPRRESRRLHGEDGVPDMWPWASRWWKPGADDSSASRIRELTKAGALIAAEIDRLQRREA